MRLSLFIAGILILLMGAVWALQGAWILPATFMRGPDWVLYGGAVAAAGALLTWRSLAAPKKRDPASTPSP